MKIVREHIYEKFTEDSDPISDMGIGQKYFIIKWFEDVERQTGYKIDYEIDDDLNIFVKGNLNLRYSKITKLPDNLTVKGYLYLQGTKITELPDNLNVKGDLYLRNTKITELPKNLKVGGDLYLLGTKITELPNDLKVRGSIYKNF